MNKLQFSSSRGDPRCTLVNESAEVRLALSVLPKTLVFSEDDVRWLNGGRA